MRIDPAHDPADTRDRLAVEHVRGNPLSDDWPAGAIRPGTRVKVIRDPEWDGPWRQEFVGVISPMGAPEPVGHPAAQPSELAYWVSFDEPQFDSSGDGPYRKALILARYLQVIP